MKPIIFTIALIICTIASFSQTKKNVLFIAVDDMKPVIGAFGESRIKTPNIDKLANKGVSFSNCHCQFAICGPSRASIMTGMRPDVTRVWDLKTKMRDENPDIITIPEYFKYNGYQTLGTGKIYDPRCIDGDRDSPSWSIAFVNEWQTPASTQGDKKEYLWFYNNEENRAYAEQLLAEAKEQGLSGGAAISYAHKFFKPATEAAQVSDEGYVDGRLANQAIKFIDTYSNTAQPFFISVGFKKPHLPFCAPQKYWDLYDSTDIVVEEYQEYNKNGAPSLAFQNSGELRDYTDISDDQILPISKQKQLIHGYYASVSYIDALVGKVVDKLEKENLLENTIIVLWGDHGFHLGDHGMWCKHTNFEQATRSPLIIVSPDNIAGTVNASPVEFVDVFPTLNDLAGLQSPEYLQGTSLARIISGETDKVNDAAYSQYNREGLVKMGYTLRTERYRYTEWMDKNWRTYNNYDISKLIGKELYDYANDPLETENKVDKTEYTSLADSLQKILHASFLEQIEGSTILPEFFNISNAIEAESYAMGNGFSIIEEGNKTVVSQFSNGNKIGYFINSNQEGAKQLHISGISADNTSQVQLMYNGESIGTFEISTSSDFLVVDIELIKGKGLIEFESLGDNWSFDSFIIRDVIEQTNNLDINKIDELKLYPNPVDDLLFITGLSPLNKIKVESINGELIHSHINSSSPLVFPANLHPGMYVVRIESGDLERSFKIIKE